MRKLCQIMGKVQHWCTIVEPGVICVGRGRKTAERTTMKSLIHPQDKYQMNWIEGSREWGTVICPSSLKYEVTTRQEGENIRETYLFTNVSNKTVFIQRGEISIFATFNDNYDTPDICLTNRCHAHIWCGGDVSYIMGIRMGGEAPHLGLALTKGSLNAYSVERDPEQLSNDRGDFLMHPTPFTLEPDESYELEWVLFWHEGEADFYEKLKAFGRFIDIKTEQYVYRTGEKINLKMYPSFPFSPESVTVMRSGMEIPVTVTDKMADLNESIENPGEYEYQIQIGGVSTICRIYVQVPLERLVKKRCRFITENQQYHNKNSRLNGAYLIYDNDEHKLHYDSDFDHNAGRERVGMGVLVAAYLQTEKDKDMLESLKLYENFVYRELYDEETGEVFNDAGRDNSYVRLYNYAWMAQFFLELHRLYGEKKYVEDAYKVLKYYYEHGGLEYYAVELPLTELIWYMEMMGMEQEIRTMMQFYYQDARNIIRTGLHYPENEVKFEQRTVASAANQLLKCYTLHKDKKFLAAAEEHVKILSLFNGHQPDYRLYESAIRHWDGYWFGKRGRFGDTFPHYWNALTGMTYQCYALVMGKKDLYKKAEACYLGALSLFYPNGSACCTNMYPYRVNGELCRGMDPWSNDQDWALYYAWNYWVRNRQEQA